MAKFTLTRNNRKVRLKNGFVDTVCVESRGCYKVGRFENQDKIDLRNFGYDTLHDANALIESSIPIQGGGVILHGTFGKLILRRITQLHPSNFILGNINPLAKRDAAFTTENTPVSIDVLANDIDPDGDPLFIEGVSRGTASGGSVKIDGDTNVVEYTPAEGFTGIDSFRYTISDRNGGTDSATVTVTVESENIPPIALDDLASTEQNTSVNISVLDNDFDPDSESISISDFTTETENGGSVEIGSDDNTLLYSPTESFTGTDSFSYTISDARDTDTATVTVTVESSGGSSGNTQIIAPVPSTQLASANQAVSIDVQYSTNPANSETTALGLRLHWDSTKLSFDGVDNIFPDDLLAQGTPSEDTDNLDGDPTTDSLIIISWVDFTRGSWPNDPSSLPISLYRANFTTASDFADSTTVNFSASSTSPDFILASTSATIGFG